MDDSGLLLALLGSAALLMLAHRQGLRWNLALARATARALEEALEPADTTYTWIGGAIGFHATYDLDGGDRVLATATFLPRHSPLYLPLARLLRGPDRLQLTFLPGPAPLGEADLAELAGVETHRDGPAEPGARPAGFYVRARPAEARRVAAVFKRVSGRAAGRVSEPARA